MKRQPTQKMIDYWASMRGKPHRHKTSNGKHWTRSKESNEKASKNHNPKSNLNLTARMQKGHIPWNKGRNGLQRCSEERRAKLREMYAGQGHPQYKHDRSSIRVCDRKWNDQLQKEWSKNVKTRDGWKCRIADENCEGRLEAHHILPWSSFPELRYEVKNGITLCHHHHPRRREDVEKLSPYFRRLVASLD